MKKFIALLTTMLAFTGCINATPQITTTDSAIKKTNVVESVPAKEKVYITVVATSYGNNKSKAKINAQKESILIATEIALDKGDAYLKNSDNINILKEKYSSIIKQTTTVYEKETDEGFITEISAKIDYTMLLDEIDNANAAFIIFENPKHEKDKLENKIHNDKIIKDTILKEFTQNLGELSNVLKVEVNGHEFDETLEDEDKITFRINFTLYVDMEEYDKSVENIIGIVENYMDGGFQYDLPLKYSKSNLNEKYAIDNPKLLNHNTIALILNNSVKIYKLGYDYQNFFDSALKSYKVVGNPYNYRLQVLLKDEKNKVMYDDLFDLTNKDTNYTVKEEFPKVSIIHNDVKYPIGEKSYIAGIITGGVLNKNIINSDFSEDSIFVRRDAIISPYIFVELPQGLTTIKELQLEYAGVMPINGISTIKQINIDSFK